MDAIETGGAGIKTLLTRLTELQTQGQQIGIRQADAEARTVEVRMSRPSLEYVQGVWRQFIDVWEAATQEQQAQLMPLLVEKVELREKERGIVRLSFSLADPRSEHAPRVQNDGLPSGRLLINCKNGRMMGLEPTTFRATT